MQVSKSAKTDILCARLFSCVKVRESTMSLKSPLVGKISPFPDKCLDCEIIAGIPLPEGKIHALVYAGGKFFERVCECHTHNISEA